MMTVVPDAWGAVFTYASVDGYSEACSASGVAAARCAMVRIRCDTESAMSWSWSMGECECIRWFPVVGEWQRE